MSQALAAGGGPELVLVSYDGPFATITMNIPERRNALSLAHLRQLIEAFRSVGDSNCRGVLLAGAGPAFCSGHDFAEMAGSPLESMRELIDTCTELMLTMQSIPQPVLARVHGIATAAGCQLVAAADLAVAARSAVFATPGGKSAWFCHTPMVAVGRVVSRKHAFELGLTGDTISAVTAASWGLINAVVDDADLDQACVELLGRATRGTRESTALGKRTLYAQLDLGQADAYRLAGDVMARSSQTPDAQESMQAFLEKRAPRYQG